MNNIKPHSELVLALIDQTCSFESKHSGSRIGSKLAKLKRFSSESRLPYIRSTESSGSSSHTHSPCPSPSSSPGIYPSMVRTSPMAALSKRNHPADLFATVNHPSAFSIERVARHDPIDNKSRVAFDVECDLETDSSRPNEQQSLRVQLQHLRHFAHEFDLGPASPELDDQCASLTEEQLCASSISNSSPPCNMNVSEQSASTSFQARVPPTHSMPLIQSASTMALKLPPSNHALPRIPVAPPPLSLPVPVPVAFSSGAAHRQLFLHEMARPPSVLSAAGVPSTIGFARTDTFQRQQRPLPVAAAAVAPRPVQLQHSSVPAGVDASSSSHQRALRPSRTVPSLEALQRLYQWLPPAPAPAPALAVEGSSRLVAGAGINAGALRVRAALAVPAAHARLPVPMASRVRASNSSSNAYPYEYQQHQQPIAPSPTPSPSPSPLVAYYAPSRPVASVGFGLDYEYNYDCGYDYNSRPEIVPPRRAHVYSSSSSSSSSSTVHCSSLSSSHVYEYSHLMSSDL